MFGAGGHRHVFGAGGHRPVFGAGGHRHVFGAGGRRPLYCVCDFRRCQSSDTPDAIAAAVT